MGRILASLRTSRDVPPARFCLAAPLYAPYPEAIQGRERAITHAHRPTNRTCVGGRHQQRPGADHLAMWCDSLAGYPLQLGALLGCRLDRHRRPAPTPPVAHPLAPRNARAKVLAILQKATPSRITEHPPPNAFPPSGHFMSRRNRSLKTAAREATEPPSQLDQITRYVQALCVLLALAFVFFVSMLQNPTYDFWWQAKAGEVILKTHSIPHQDPFSWTASGQPWMVHEWLTDVLFYWLAHRPLGWLLAYKCGLSVLVCGLALLRTWQRSRSVPLAVGAVVVVGFVMRDFADLRPQMLTFTLLNGLLVALDAYQRGGARWLPWGLPVVFVIWANLHGAAVVGLLLIALWVGGEAIGKWMLGEQGPSVLPLALGVAASCLAVGINPNGFLVYAYPFQVLGHPQVKNYILEWVSPDFHGLDNLPFEVLLLGLFGAMALARAGGRPRFGELLMLLAMAYAALYAVRNAPAFALAAAPPTAVALASVWKEAPGLVPIRKLAAGSAARLAGAGALALTLALLLASQFPRAAPRSWAVDTIDYHSFPIKGAQLLAEGNWPGPLYNDYNWGGYLIWSLYPARKVFIDGRAEIYYSTGTLDDDIRIHNVAPGWHEALDRRGVQVVLTKKDEWLAEGLRHQSDWRSVFAGPVEQVFVRAPGADASP